MSDPIDTSELDRLIALLQTIDPQIEQSLARRFGQVLQDVLGSARQAGHQLSGNMVRSMYTLGPFPLGGGDLEGLVDSGVGYSVYELERGGEHDWATRAIAANLGTMQRFADDTGRDIGRILGGT
jgi:hypothetical protein